MVYHLPPETSMKNLSEDMLVIPLESRTGMENLGMSFVVPLEEVPSPENTVHPQSDDHLQVQGMLLLFCHCVLSISMCAQQYQVQDYLIKCQNMGDLRF